jgi:diadenosine tetraphosphate (Ap4A) HIT family hydrolase
MTSAFPISPRNTLIIPKRHVGSFFELEADERAELLALLDKTTPEEVR